MTTPIESLDDELLKIITEQRHIAETGGDGFEYRLAEALTAYITERELIAQQQLIRNIKDSEGYGKMPVGMRDLLSDFSQHINAQLQTKEEQTNE